jgi:hypothetical protein
MSSKTPFHVALIAGAALFSTLPTNSWSQSFIEQWKEQSMQRMEAADFQSFDAANTDWYNSNATPQIKTSVPALDELEEALQPWGQDPAMEDRCVQSLLEGNMLRLQLLHVLQGLYGSDLERELNSNEIPASFQWIPILASSYNHSFRSTKSRAGLWGLTAAQADKEGIVRDDTTDERMLPQESTRAAVAILDGLQRRFPANPERVLVGFIKGMPYAARWSGEPGYDADLDEWLAFYRVLARFMVNLDAPNFETQWGQVLTTWTPVACPGELTREGLSSVLGMPLSVQQQLLPWWKNESLPCATFEEFEPYLPQEWSSLWNAHMEELGEWKKSTSPQTTAAISPIPEPLIAANPIADRSADCFKYEVKKGDTLYNLSKRYPGTSPESIAATNGIVSVIKIGQILCIPRVE